MIRIIKRDLLSEGIYEVRGHEHFRDFWYIFEIVLQKITYQFIQWKKNTEIKKTKLYLFDFWNISIVSVKQGS